MKLKQGLIINQIDDEYIIVDLGIAEPIFNGMIKLNETGKEIVEELLNKDTTIDDLVNKLISEYDVDGKEAHEDVLEIIKELEKAQLIIK